MARMLGWEREWRLSNTIRQNEGGTIGRGTLVDVSQMRVVVEPGSEISFS